MNLYLIKQRAALPFIGLALLLASGCGYNLRGTTQVPPDLQALMFESDDPYGPLARAVDKQLRLNGITIEEDHSRASLPSLRITRYTENRDTASIFRDGKTAEYQLVISVDAQVIIPNKDVYPITVTAHRTFFDNPLSALAKDAEQELIIKEMREEAAQKIVRKLLSVNYAAAEKQAAVSDGVK